ncbi:hypothetical protein L873DRAFT_1715905, partial [Choiromyces venosus 120613-1]
IIYQEPWYAITLIPHDNLIGISENGYNNDELSIKWLVHFEQYFSRGQVGKYQLLLLHTFNSYWMNQSINHRDTLKVIASWVPLHSSHLLELLDIVVFQTYKHYYAEVVEAAT